MISLSQSFKNWFSDDWLSEVYGDRYLKRGHDVVVRHNVGQVTLFVFWGAIVVCSRGCGICAQVGQRYPADQVSAR